MLGFVASNIISKYILQSHIDVTYLMNKRMKK
jgi:hypothetical protein